jgi:DNA-binding transcriptional ArsR family regulator
VSEPAGRDAVWTDQRGAPATSGEGRRGLERAPEASGQTPSEPAGRDAAFQALAEPRRREILRLVRDRPRSVNEIAERFDVTQQAISQHLKVLRDAGLVAVRPDGQRRLYVVRPEGLAALWDFLAEFWPDSLQRLKQAVESVDER